MNLNGEHMVTVVSHLLIWYASCWLLFYVAEIHHVWQFLQIDELNSEWRRKSVKGRRTCICTLLGVRLNLP